MVRWILISILSLGIAGTAYWGYQEHQEKNAILVQAENTYQRSFHELTYHMDLLHDKIGTAIAMSSSQNLSPQLVEIWRLTSEAHSNVGQLPLSLLPFNKTEEFLSNIGQFTYRTAVRDLENEPLTEEEKETLQNLYEQSGDIKNDLREVQHIALKNNLRWMDVQLALATSDEQMDNTIINGFQTVEKRVGEFSEGNVDSPLTGLSSTSQTFDHISGDEYDEDEAINKALDILQLEDANREDIIITESGDGADIPFYSLAYQNDEKSATMDMTKQGGHPLQIIVNRDLNDKNISLNEGQLLAEKYLEQFDYENMEVFQSSEYNQIGLYSFLYNDDGIKVYSDAIEVKVALDNGDILGLTTREYLLHHHDRDIPSPIITEAEAQEAVNPDVDIQDFHLAVIQNDLDEEVLTYAFLGVLGDDTYRIFINAMDGKEEKVEKLSGAEVNYNRMI